MIIVVIIGFVGVMIYLSPNSRNRGVRDSTHTIGAAEQAEREMDRRRDRVSEQERRRRQGPGRRGF